MNSMYQPPAARLSQAPVDDGIPDEALIAFCGSEAVARRGRDYLAGKRRTAGFSFPAMFAGTAWFFARGLYLNGAVMFGIQFAAPFYGPLLAFLLSLANIDVPMRGGIEAFVLVPMLLVRIGFGFLGNMLLVRRGVAVIREVDLLRLPPERRLEAIGARSSLNMAYGVGVFLLALGYELLLIAKELLRLF